MLAAHYITYLYLNLNVQHLCCNTCTSKWNSEAMYLDRTTKWHVIQNQINSKIHALKYHFVTSKELNLSERYSINFRVEGQHNFLKLHLP